MASEKFHSYINYIILILFPIIIFVALITGISEYLDIFGLHIHTPDYLIFYQRDWTALLGGQNPYNYWIGPDQLSSYYPPGFLVFGGFYFFHPLLPKIFFCLVWLLTAYLINGIAKKHDVSRKSTIYFCIGLIIINPMYLAIVLIAGHYDVVVGLCVLLAVYALDHSEQIKSGIYTASAFLLKFLGLILIFPLVFKKKKINWRLGVTFIAISGGIYLLCYLLWGSSIFQPIITQILRVPKGGSILVFISEVLGFDVGLILPYLFIIGAIIAAIFLYFRNTDTSSFSLILILCFLMILPTFYVHYGAWFTPLAIYWSITHNGKLQFTIILYYIGALISGLISVFVVVWAGGVFLFCITGVFALAIYFNRNKEEVEEK
ncbi:MAG: DUF2029 domain-containing protein [Candidatus Helarchaeota archaeon]|nr:DUF2029 domain-containing protein [Candidatus Helarchaeota archaeon]